ncbi:MAG: hypothetical protein IKF16_01375 [Lachnospiraceae bacterium]|nr:hypothetical protein [Eubacterium sp.]MBR3164811.1 hypothetical protein [Lachnospiraceae bacterium]MBR3187254.1 hypothetical protein [Lachnospiraceae bacterium]
MNRDEIRDVVVETVKELRNSGLLRRQDDVAYAEMAVRLYEYYKAPDRDEKMGEALRKIHGDYYFRILPDFYWDQKTIEQIAASFDCEVSTITRNKKRLCLHLARITIDD